MMGRDQVAGGRCSWRLAVIWGIPYLLIKVADEAFTPATLVFFRTAIGALS
jgi:hypothetical protein